MVDIPKLRERVTQIQGGLWSAQSAGNYLAAALDEIEELRGEIASLRAENESFRVELDRLRGRIVVCPGCGNTFRKLRKNRKFCTPVCANRTRTRLYRERIAGIKKNSPQWIDDDEADCAHCSDIIVRVHGRWLHTSSLPGHSAQPRGSKTLGTSAP